MKTFQIIIILLLCILVNPVFVSNAEEVKPATEERGDRLTEDVLNVDEIVRVLVIFVVLSVVFEVALTPIFQWRIFLKYCHKKGYRTPIAVILAFGVFWSYNLDIVTDLLRVLGHEIPKTMGDTTLGGQALTALLIAGGSNGIFQIFTKLGIRNPVAIDKKAIETLKALEERKKPKSESQS